MQRKFDRERIAWFPEFAESKSLPKILDPRPGERKQCVLLGGPLVGCYVHYHLGRTIPCTEPRGECPGCCDAGTRRDLVYFVGGATTRNWKPVLAKITSHALQTCNDLAFAEQFPGFLLTTSRAEGDHTARMSASLKAVRLPDDLVLDPFDVKAALVAIWECEGRVKVNGSLARGKES